MRITGPRGVPVRISPQAEVLPANTLRFYLMFAQPAEAHFDREHLRLLDDHDRAVPEPFLLLPYELWSTDRRRLTVLMEPGRIKRGMGADPAHEPALVVGRTYSLVITALGYTARQTFRVSDPVLDPVLDPVEETSWRLSTPAVGSREAVVVHFGRVMDAALCEGEIHVLDPSGEVVETRVSTASDGTVASVVPTQPWRDGEHLFIASDRLEDVCGNRLGEALDHELGAAGPPRAATISFTPRS